MRNISIAFLSSATVDLFPEKRNFDCSYENRYYNSTLICMGRLYFSTKFPPENCRGRQSVTKGSSHSEAQRRQCQQQVPWAWAQGQDADQNLGGPGSPPSPLSSFLPLKHGTNKNTCLTYATEFSQGTNRHYMEDIVKTGSCSALQHDYSACAANPNQRGCARSHWAVPETKP